MSYALVAELPPIYGLYSALVPLALYAVRLVGREFLSFFSRFER